MKLKCIQWFRELWASFQIPKSNPFAVHTHKPELATESELKTLRVEEAPAPPKRVELWRPKIRPEPVIDVALESRVQSAETALRKELAANPRGFEVTQAEFINLPPTRQYELVNAFRKEGYTLMKRSKKWKMWKTVSDLSKVAEATLTEQPTAVLPEVHSLTADKAEG